jgi:hypothetical protein
MSGEEYSELGMKMSLEDYRAAREKNLVLLNRLHSKPSA